jgi:serine/threonine-protein kinase
VLLSYSGIVKVADFGIAKAKVTTAELTQPGELKGKVAFMSPEQLACEPLDRRADIFAMGTLLYTITTGHHPFRGSTTAKTYDNITACNPPKPSAVTRQYPADLEHVVLKALAADRNERWQTAAEMFSALVETQHGSQGHFESTVAGYMRQVMGDKERERATLLQRCQSASPSSLRPSTPPPSPDRITLPTITNVARDSHPPSAESLSPAVLRTVATTSDDGPSTSTLISFIRGRRRKAWLAALTIGGTLVFGAAAAKMTVLPRAQTPLLLDHASEPLAALVGGPTELTPTQAPPGGPTRPAMAHASSEPTNSIVNVQELHISAPLDAPASSRATKRAAAPVSAAAPDSVQVAPVSAGPLDAAQVARVYLPQELPAANRRRREAAPAPEPHSAATSNRLVDAWDRTKFGGRN